MRWSGLVRLEANPYSVTNPISACERRNSRRRPRHDDAGDVSADRLAVILKEFELAVPAHPNRLSRAQADAAEAAGLLELDHAAADGHAYRTRTPTGDALAPGHRDSIRRCKV